MRTLMNNGLAIRIVAGAALAVTLGGCSYDYLQHSDRVAYSSGDAVKANLERETIDPARASKDSTVGLGKNGHTVPVEADPIPLIPTP